MGATWRVLARYAVAPMGRSYAGIPRQRVGAQAPRERSAAALAPYQRPTSARAITSFMISLVPP